jgi:hypothetical protein
MHAGVTAPGLHLQVHKGLTTKLNANDRCATHGMHWLVECVAVMITNRRQVMLHSTVVQHCVSLKSPALCVVVTQAVHVHG